MIGVGLVLVSAVLLALTITLAKLSYAHGADELSVILVRFAVLVPALLIWFRLARRPMRLPPGKRLPSLVIGLLSWSSVLAYLGAVRLLPIGIAVLLLYTFPILVMLIEAGLAQRRPTTGEGAGTLVAFGGLALALDVSLDGLDPLGIGFGLLAATLVSVQLVLTQRVTRESGTMRVTLYMAFAALVLSAFAELGFGNRAFPTTADGWWIYIGMAASFAAAYTAMFGAIGMIGSVRTGLVMFLEPPVTMTFGIVILGEMLAGRQLIGAVLVLGAVVTTQALRARADAKPAPES